MDKALLIGEIAELIGDARHVAAGALSPIPAAAAMLAKRQHRAARVSLLGSRRFSSYTDGGRELFDSAAQGRIDVFFLSGAEIDGEANINLVSIGGYKRPTARFSGSFGSPYLYMLIPRVILFRPEHNLRTLVTKVDFISAPGSSPPHVYRPGGPAALITGRCLFDWNKQQAALFSPQRSSRRDRRRACAPRPASTMTRMRLRLSRASPIARRASSFAPSSKKTSPRATPRFAAEYEG